MGFLIFASVILPLCYINYQTEKEAKKRRCARLYDLTYKKAA